MSSESETESPLNFLRPVIDKKTVRSISITFNDGSSKFVKGESQDYTDCDGEVTQDSDHNEEDVRSEKSDSVEVVLLPSKDVAVSEESIEPVLTGLDKILVSSKFEPLP